MTRKEHWSFIRAFINAESAFVEPNQLKETIKRRIHAVHQNNINSRGFKHPPRDLNFMAFSQLYKRRSAIDYAKSTEMIRSGVYNAFIHNSIMRLYRD